MNRRVYSLINGILLLFVLVVVILTAIFLAIQINSYRDRYEKEALLLQNEYTESQKALVKREVLWVYDYINSNLASLDQSVEERVQMRIEEAYSIADNIYRENLGKMSDAEIQQIIRQALRPVRYRDGQGYFFIKSFSGVEILLPDRPELEGQNLLNLQSSDGSYILRDMIDICREKGEGFYEYTWTKPGEEGNGHSKISYLKHFQPYDWIIGTGLYMDDEEEVWTEGLLKSISDIRFGKEGYIFVNSMDGNALVSNGEMMSGDQKLWEVFSSNPERTRDLFRKEYEAALKPDGDFIYYTIRKLTDSTEESPKVSYIMGIPELNWLVGAGVYLDDVQSDILKLNEISYSELREDIVSTVIISLSLLSVFIFLFFLMGRRLEKEFNHFSDFFESSISERAELDEGDFLFRELSGLAQKANSMQRDKIDALEKLSVSENRFRLLAENSRDMIFKLILPEGRYEYISPASLDVTGYTPKEIMDEPYFVRKVIHPDWVEWLEDRFRSIFSGEIDDTYEYPIIDKSGEERWVSQKNTLIKGEEEGSYMLIGRLSDETRRKKAEEELNRRFRMEAIGKLAGGVAHDFNNVLAGIMNAANVLKSPRRQIDEKGRAMADLILKAAGRAADLTAKLSAFGGKRTLILKPQNIHQILEETEALVKRTLDKQIGIHINLSASNDIVKADGTEIQSIVLNLVINASHAIEGSGHIFINTENTYLDEEYCRKSSFDCFPGQYIRIEILDTGMGMDSKTLERIFEPFFTTKEQGKGTGLGLATVFRSVQDHKGLIQVTSEVGEGTSFLILLPCMEDVQNQTALQGRVSGESITGTILLVDDEDFLRETGQTILEEMGYHVLTASNGKEAVDLFKESSPEIDLVILDIMMPEMGGIEAFRLMKAIRKDCPVILSTGFSQDDELSSLKDEGLFGIIRKPFDQAMLKNEINLALTWRKEKE